MEKRKNQNQNRSSGQNWRETNRNKNDNSLKNNGDGAVAGPSWRNERNKNKNKFEATGPIGYKTLANLLKVENDAELILELSSSKNGFFLRLDQQSIESGFMCLILDALARISKSSTETDMIQLLVHFYMKIIQKLDNDSNFYRGLKIFIGDLSKHFEKCSDSHSQKYVEAIQSLLVFLRRLQLTIYQKSFDIVRDLMHLINVQIDFINKKGNLLNDFIIEKANELNTSVKNFAQMKKETEKVEKLIEPPQDYREIPIYPNAFEILNDPEPFIRANIVEGKYVAGVDHYLDIQFRLLREDFVRPLRIGITQYRNIRNNEKEMAAAKFRINDLNIYRNVRIFESKMIRNDQVHSCKFDCTPFRYIRWQFNKRMMNGSLVCLSQDDFETFFFATVAGQREPEKLARGEFQIKLEIESSAMPKITPLITFVMVESTVYFESYRHNLKVLQAFGKDNFPLEKYIVDVNKNISPPSYLTNDSVYKISNGLPDDDPDAKKLQVEMMSSEQWPPREHFNLDESQYEAFRAGLTKQMVVIQGPPGTGKTYIGLRIVEVLLNNTSEWPILIVCYTNHALDQFLEGILKLCGDNELVRIGGKSQNEALEKYNLSRIKSQMKLNREVPSYIHEPRSESSYRLREIQENISDLESDIEHISNTIFGDRLRKVIRRFEPAHYQQLNQLTNGRSFNDGILNWLGYAMTLEGNGQENNENNIDEENANEMEQEIYEEEMDEEDVRETEWQRYINESSDEDDVVDNNVRGTMREPKNYNNTVPLVEDADGFQYQKHQQKHIKHRMKQEINKLDTMEENQAKRIKNINTLSPNDRWRLYRLWIKIFVREFEAKIEILRDEYKTEYLRFDGLRKQEDIEIIKNAKIIGMTTTGAAKYRHIIDGTKPKITIVEEAAEVLEAHIVTALCKHTDHLILIGDHLQLRPNPAVYELAKKYKLEISLFERLIKNRMEYYPLTQQHRMRPCISSLLVPHIYKQLLDHPSVEKYEDVKGISKNMFFIKHRENEKSMQETRSHLNMHEAEFIVALCRYVVLQGYETSQVTILTTYSGQLNQIRQLMRYNNQLLDGVRATVVDNYQGEECDIILLSFVRSNDEGNIGFLKDSHRINVALSRARKGLYCIGNFDCLAEKSPLWQNLMSDLTAKAAIGDVLELYCQNHTDYKSLVNSKDGFDAAPEGGCSRSCGYRLPCGHSCESVCHIIDIQHQDQYGNCHKRCDQIICDRDHRCPQKCHYGEDCAKCTAMVEKIRTDCEHNVLATCSSDPALISCNRKCQKIRSCGHDCRGLCSELCESINCNEKVQIKSPCGHTITVNCADAKNNFKILNACTEPCKIELKCGHLCQGSCGKCAGRLHMSCKKKCSRILICGHRCPDTCSVECKPCEEPCENRCVHSKCSYRCGDPCPPCKEKCSWCCKHLKCSKLCSEPCDRDFCEYPNMDLLKKCEHPSIGVCGEKMPKLCRICDKHKVEEIFFGNEDEKDARFIELYDCKHIIEINGLIGWMKSEPESDESNPNANNRMSIQFKECPKCKTPIRRTKSLNTFIQASLRDIQQVKLKTCGDPRVNKANQWILFNKVQDILEKNPFINDPLHLKSIYECICNKMRFKKGHKIANPNQILVQLNNQFESTERLRQISEALNDKKILHENICSEALESFDDRLKKAASFIRKYNNCEQQRADIENEWKLLQLMSDVIVKASHQTFSETGKKSLNDAFEMANKFGSATDSVRKQFQENVTLACKHSSGIGISMEEKGMVLKAMGLSKGHWYKCPKNHVYCIGNCGGPNQTSKCPECGTAIGGEQHRLVAGNAVATEMDGATRAAWPQ